MRILKVEPGKAPYAKELEEGLKAIQRACSSPSLWGTALFSAVTMREN